jgi:phosphonate metabolism protein PhnN/1,5-bisphosphokinase (PRPP-forming)
MLVLIVGPSGAGKDTLLDAVRAKLAGRSDIRFARREITRNATPGGEDHLPVDLETFQSRCRSGGYALWWEAHGLGYGIGADITHDLAAGRIVVASVSRAVIPEAATRFDVRVIEVTAPPEVLAQRLASRGRESAEDIARRLQRQVKLPADIPCLTVMNDDTVAVGASNLLHAIETKMQTSKGC